MTLIAEAKFIGDFDHAEAVFGNKLFPTSDALLRQVLMWGLPGFSLE